MEVTLVHGTSRSVVELADGIEAPYDALLDAAADLSGSHPSDLLLFGLPFEADYGPLDVGAVPHTAVSVAVLPRSPPSDASPDSAPGPSSSPDVPSSPDHDFLTACTATICGEAPLFQAVYVSTAGSGGSGDSGGEAVSVVDRGERVCAWCAPRVGAVSAATAEGIAAASAPLSRDTPDLLGAAFVCAARLVSDGDDENAAAATAAANLGPEEVVVRLRADWVAQRLEERERTLGRTGAKRRQANARAPVLQRLLVGVPPCETVPQFVSPLRWARWHDDGVLDSIREQMPLDTLMEAASLGASFQRGLVGALANWFSTEWFQWLASPACPNGMCGAPSTSFVGRRPPTSGDDVRLGALFVEVYHCGSCGWRSAFPRSTRLEVLAQNRFGRSAEAAQLFVACCRALGVDARFVSDTATYSWNEVFLEDEDTWVAVDPVENLVDAPHVMEGTWGMKLPYVFAWSRDEVVDVTRRYARDFGATTFLRTTVGEAWLADAIANINEERAAVLAATGDDDTLAALITRRIAEDEQLAAMAAIADRDLSEAEQTPRSRRL